MVAVILDIHNANRASADPCERLEFAAGKHRLNLKVFTRIGFRQLYRRPADFKTAVSGCTAAAADGVSAIIFRSPALPLEESGALFGHTGNTGCRVHS